VAWFVLPWRLCSRAVLRLSLWATGSRPSVLLGAVVAAGLVVAIVQEVQAETWAGAAVLVALAVGGTVVPIADAAVSRASERAADRFAARAGYAEALADALAALDPGPVRPPGFLNRKLAGHPDCARRAAELRASDEVLAPPGVFPRYM